MKKSILIVALIALFVKAPAQNITHYLYESSNPAVDNGYRPSDEAVNEKRFYSKICNPFVKIFLPEKCNGQMIVICPGGAYSSVCSSHEGDMVVDWALSRGIAACLVIYRLPNQHCTVPLDDVQQAFRYCRANADKWGVKQIGIIGFSAGGHLAASASTLFVDDATRPDFSILIYPVITMGELTHMGSRNNLLGKDPDKSLIEKYSLENRVTAATPPTFLALSQNDKVVVPQNSLMYYDSLLKNGVSAEIHIFTYGGHGWGFGPLPGNEDSLGDQRGCFNEELSRWVASQCK